LWFGHGWASLSAHSMCSVDTGAPMRQWISRRPVGAASAPYFLAFVPSSCNTSERATADCGVSRAGGPSTVILSISPSNIS
jgi:hypothetical protein